MVVGVPLSGGGLVKIGWGIGHRILTFWAEVQTFHMEDPAPEGNLLKDDAKAVYVTSLGATGRRGSHSQELRGGPQFFCGPEVRSQRRRGPKAKG